MSPIFAIAAWPITFIYGRKIVLWYLHRSVTPRLQFAEKLCASIVTADKDSLQLKSSKVVEVGNGIEVEKFRGEHDWNRTNPLRIISVGRISPIKNYETLIQAAYLLREKNFNFKVQIVGRPVIAGDLAYEQDLKKCITDLNLGDQIIFKGFVPHTQMPALYKEADMVVNLTPTGGIDKTNLEAMASGCITLTSNQVFRKYFGQYASQLIFEHNNAQDLADKIFDLARQTSEKKKNISDFLVNIAQSYSIPKVIAKISALL